MESDCQLRDTWHFLTHSFSKSLSLPFFLFLSLTLFLSLNSPIPSYLSFFFLSLTFSLSFCLFLSFSTFFSLSLSFLHLNWCLSWSLQWRAADADATVWLETTTNGFGRKNNILRRFMKLFCFTFLSFRFFLLKMWQTRTHFINFCFC